MTCMGRLHHLQQTLPLIARQPGLKCILVDYGCPDGSGDWVESALPQVQVVRAPRLSHFNVCKARNLGAAHAGTPWLCFMDADTLACPDFFGRVAHGLQDRIVLLADPCPDSLTGLVVCSREDFTRLGGYDELFSSWGTEDRDLYVRLGRSGCTLRKFASDGIKSIEHGDAERMRFSDIEDRFVSLRVNGMYFQIKTDLARLTEVVELPLPDRQAIYTRVRDLVLTHRHTRVKMDITLPVSREFAQPPDWRLGRVVSYAFEPFAHTPPAPTHV
ncbi:MAG: galactosyltransferase-related protein [Burkholderiaceae bacterium]